MAHWIRILPKAQRQIKALPHAIQERIVRAVRDAGRHHFTVGLAINRNPRRVCPHENTLIDSRALPGKPAVALWWRQLTV